MPRCILECCFWVLATLLSCQPHEHTRPGLCFPLLASACCGIALSLFVSQSQSICYSTMLSRSLPGIPISGSFSSSGRLYTPLEVNLTEVYGIQIEFPLPAISRGSSWNVWTQVRSECGSLPWSRMALEMYDALSPVRLLSWQRELWLNDFTMVTSMVENEVMQIWFPWKQTQKQRFCGRWFIRAFSWEQEKQDCAERSYCSLNRDVAKLRWTSEICRWRHMLGPLVIISRVTEEEDMTSWLGAFWFSWGNKYGVPWYPWKIGASTPCGYQKLWMFKLLL